MNKKAGIMENKLLGLIIILVFVAVMIGIYMVVRGKVNSNMVSIFKFF